jgi:dihydroorotase
MIHIKQVMTMDGNVVDMELPSKEERTIEARGLTLLPALIDPHVHFRTPGFEHKENWITAARAAIHGGITTVFDMPNTFPTTITLERLLEKKAIIDDQLKKTGVPIHYGLYLGASKNHFDEIHRCKPLIVGIKLFMGSSTGDLLIDDPSSLHAIFSLAASHDLLLAVHAEDEALIQERKKLFESNHPRDHSRIRNEEVALRATETAIELSRLYKTRLYLLHIGTSQELEVIAKAKREGLPIYAETTPHHLFLTTDAYETLGTSVQMNPPIRSQEHVNALWDAIREGVIDTIGSDHAPHTKEEKAKPYGQAPSGIPGIETTLPLLLNACNQGRLALRDIVRLMRDNALRIFRFSASEDYILVDMRKMKTIDPAHLKSKCGWSPYAGWNLQGWPIFTILNGHVYALE